MTSKLPIDPHDERLAKMTLLNKENFKPSNINDKIGEYLNLAREQNSSLSSMRQSNFKDFTFQNQQLRDFNEKVLKQYEDLHSQRYNLSNKMKFQMLNEPVMSDFIIDPSQINPILKASDNRIKALEEEMDVREKDIAKLSGVIEVLIDENKYLREHVSVKNKEIAKIMETVGGIDGESIHDLRNRILLLSEENNILLGHLDELRSIRDNFDSFAHEKFVEIEKERESYETCRRALEDALAREEALNTYRNNMELKFKQLNERIFDLEANNQDLADECNSLRNQNMLLTNQIQQTKRNFEDQDHKRGMEFDKTIEEVNGLHNDKKELKRNLDIKERALDEITNEARKFKREAEVARNELEEAVQTIAELKNQLVNERITSDNIIKREKDYKERNDKLATELEKAQIRLQNIEAQNSRAIDSMRNDYQIRIQKYEQMIDTVKQKKSEMLKEKDDEISNLTHQIIDLKKNLTKVKQDRDEYHRRMNDAAISENEVQQKDEVISELHDKIATLNRELIDVQHEKSRIEEKSYQGRLSKQDFSAEKNKGVGEGYFLDSGEKPPRIANHEVEMLRAKITELVAENTQLKSQVESINQTLFLSSKKEGVDTNNDKYLQQILRNGTIKSEFMTQPNFSIENSKEDYNVSPPKATVSNPRVGAFDVKSNAVTFNTNPNSSNDYGSLTNINQNNTHMSQPDVDRVISNILKKYNMEKVPESSREDIQKVLSYPIGEGSANYLGYASWGNDTHNRVGNTWRSPNVNFLSPLISSGKKESLIGSGYAFKDDDLRSIPFTTPEKETPGPKGNYQNSAEDHK